MVEFFSKSSEPNRDDARMRNILRENRSTIVRLADQFSQGAYSASRAPREAPKAEGLIIHTGTRTPVADIPEPYAKVSLNGRVLVVDGASGRQLDHLGNVLRVVGESHFRLATSANGFFDPIDDDKAEALASLDGCRIDADFPESAFLAEIETRLGIKPTTND
ncbi:hypothetical protein [Segnochrobactrum spirostomi]|uniref:Uncharacterized protein n=1 Tax=Segnochrobactrum spirostomi TaxID=2608987 RepID=A0A6A7Y6D8_9HYPH|nr:hypothetical protein [Segnochrobactrum spirostomi]MQT14804.1 hypothetical protein [Segnochrobactrum spirostomi]